MNPTSPSPQNSHTPEEIALRAGLEFPQLLLPDPGQLFADRAVRLRQLAANHALRDYLMMLALVCEAQHARSQQHPAPTLPTPAQFSAAMEAGEPPLEATGWPRDASWRSELRALLQQVLEQMPGDSPAGATVRAVQALSDETLEQQADRLLAGITLGLDMAAAPLIAAGLQLHFTQLAAAIDPEQAKTIPVPAQASRCPCCGSLPVASVARVGGKQDGQRYLHCTLCNTQWHQPRIQCTHCGSTDGIHYESLQPLADAQAPQQRAAVEAEACDGCHHYLKIMHQSRDVHVEPVADDLATLTLDLLVSEAGFNRHGTNMLLLFGDSDPGDS